MNLPMILSAVTLWFFTLRSDRSARYWKLLDGSLSLVKVESSFFHDRGFVAIYSMLITL